MYKSKFNNHIAVLGKFRTEIENAVAKDLAVSKQTLSKAEDASKSGKFDKNAWNKLKAIYMEDHQDS